MKKIKYILFFIVGVFFVYETITNTNWGILKEEKVSQFLHDYPGSVWKSKETGYILTGAKGNYDHYITVTSGERYRINSTAGGREYMVEYEVLINDDGESEYALVSGYSNIVNFLITIEGGEKMTMTWYDFSYSSGDTSKEVEEVDRKRTKELFEKYGEITFERIK